MSQTKAQLIDNLVQPITGAAGSASAPTFSFTADPNTGIYSPGADQIAVATNGVQRLYIDSTGSIGVGTTTKAWESGQFFAVQFGKGGAVFGRAAGDEDRNGFVSNAYHDAAGWKYIASSAHATRYEQSDGNHLWYYADTGTADASVAFSEAMRITSAGLVGIGTSSPSNDLDVLKTASGSTTTARIGATATSGANNATLILNNGGTGNATLRFDYEGSTNRASIGVLASDQKLTLGTAGSTAMTIDASQRVGVGNATPGARLDVNAGTDNTVAIFTSTDAGAYASFNDPIGQGIVGQDGANLILSCDPGASVGSSAIVFQVDANTERARIDSSGRSSNCWRWRSRGNAC
jgi:hypothetical protein